jgi:hypothetical protein
LNFTLTDYRLILLISLDPDGGSGLNTPSTTDAGSKITPGENDEKRARKDDRKNERRMVQKKMTEPSAVKSAGSGCGEAQPNARSAA